MRITEEMEEVGGINRTEGRGFVVTDSTEGWDFTVLGVTAGVDTLYNKTTGDSALVSAVTANTIETASVWFEFGDFYLVTLTTPYLIRDADGVVIRDNVCSVCGFSFREKDLVGDKCRDCRDLPQRSMRRRR